MCLAQEELRITAEYNEPLPGIFQDLENKYGLRIYFQEDWLPQQPVARTFSNNTIEEVLTGLTSGFKLNFYIFRSNLVLITPEDIQDFRDEYTTAEVVARRDLIDVGDEGPGENAVIEGYVKSGETGEPLIGASVTIDETGTGMTTNILGYFRINLKKGIYRVRSRYLGWNEEEKWIDLKGDGRIDFDMFEEVVELGGVVISDVAPDENINSLGMSLIRLDMKDISTNPAVLGEVDIVKSIQMLPGVGTVGEGAPGFNVRGGNIDQNLVLIDGTPIFNTSHLFGFYSIMNAESIDEFTLYKGSMPASFGGRTASVLDIRMREGSTKEFDLKGGIGPISQRLSVEAPIFSDKASFLFTARNSGVDWILRQIQDVDIKNSRGSFYDFSGKIFYRLSNRDRISVSGYFSNDEFQFAGETQYNYENKIGTANWLHVFGDNLNINLYAGYSDYQYDIRELDPAISNFQGSNDAAQLLSGITYSGGGLDLQYVTPGSEVSWGGRIENYRVNPGERIPGPGSSVSPKTLESEEAVVLSGYAEGQYVLNDQVAFSAGIRYNYFRNLGPSQIVRYFPGEPREVTTISDTLFVDNNSNAAEYAGFEPRASFKYSLNTTSSIKLSYQKTRQYLHLLSNTVSTDPFAIWRTANRYLRPLSADQLSLGYFRNFKNNTVETSVEVYYRNTNNALEYKDGAELVMSEIPESELIEAQEQAYGLELLVKKRSGRLNGWIGYTFSRARRRTITEFPREEINFGSYYPANFDRPHEISIVGNFTASKRWQFSGNFVFNSGRPTSFPTARYEVGQGVDVIDFSERNDFRIPNYHRLDVSLTLEPGHKRKRKWEGSWTFSIYNLYGRQNAYSIFFGRREVTDPPLTPYRLAILARPLPSFSYNFKF